MVRKIIDACAVVGLLVSGSLAVGSFMLFKYVQSPQFELKVKNKLMGDIQKKLPKTIEKTLPSTTGLGIPM
mgnify:FL=1|tara:strand:- start:119 stop:331 length:213 start_codon:yes stop_codon:yes gene_type:complete